MTPPPRLQLHPRRHVVAILAVLACPAAALAADQPPLSDFSISPDDPRAGQQVRLVSSACDPDGRIVRQEWDLDGDGAYDDAVGRVATRAFPSAGVRTVGLRVRSAGGKVDRRRRALSVDSEYALPRPDSDRLMSPYPVVRLAGRLTSRGALIRILSVSRAPKCAVVRVSCAGSSCPAKRASGFVGRGPLRFRRFERRLRAGTVLTVRVSKGDRIGKFTRFRIGLGRAPARADRCLRPGARTPSRCPRD